MCMLSEPVEPTETQTDVEENQNGQVKWIEVLQGVVARSGVAVTSKLGQAAPYMYIHTINNNYH